MRKEQEGNVGSVDPLSDEMRMRLCQIDPRIDPFKFRELVLEQLLHGRVLANLPVSEQRAINFLVKIEYEHDLDRHVQRYVQRLSSQQQQQSLIEISILEKGEQYAGVCLSDDGDEEKPTEVDMPIAPGMLTSLHIAAAEGDLVEVKRLIEQENACPFVKDSYGLTPIERSEMMGQIGVTEYLRKVLTR